MLFNLVSIEEANQVYKNDESDKENVNILNKCCILRITHI